ncbi:MAG TPA: sugar kinase [Noviherbaspirillum sp.]|nr:sugar kinase [Noviherbaspirillum sp.]
MDRNENWFIGECMIELRRAQGGLLRQDFAGDAYNAAVYFRRSAPARRAWFVTAVGQDSMSEALLDHGRKHGLELGYLARASAKLPGLYLIETSPDGERSFLYWRSDSAARQMLSPEHCDVLQQRIMACDLFYFSGITLAILDDARRDRLLMLASAVKANAGWVCFDSNYRPSLWQSKEEAQRWSNSALATTTHALVTFDDEAQLFGDLSPHATLSRTLAAGAAEVVVKLGRDGCIAQTATMSEFLTVPAEKAEAIDTTAAGDSFNAAYLAARRAQASLDEAARTGARLAAQVIQVAGAIIDGVL